MFAALFYKLRKNSEIGFYLCSRTAKSGSANRQSQSRSDDYSAHYLIITHQILMYNNCFRISFQTNFFFWFKISLLKKLGIPFGDFVGMQILTVLIRNKLDKKES